MLHFLTVVFLPADGNVSAKIAEELAYEKEAGIPGEPEFLTEFNSSGIWTVCPFSYSFNTWRLTWSQLC